MLFFFHQLTFSFCFYSSDDVVDYLLFWYRREDLLKGRFDIIRGGWLVSYSPSVTRQ